VISPDTEERLRGLWNDQSFSFPGLRDPEARVIRAYGILNEASPPLPHPSTLVIDSEGVVRWLEVDEDYKVRPAADTVLEALAKIEGPG
jgi:peroxiredoxin